MVCTYQEGSMTKGLVGIPRTTKEVSNRLRERQHNTKDKLVFQLLVFLNFNMLTRSETLDSQ